VADRFQIASSSSAIASARALMADGRTGDAEQILRVAASGGDTTADRELGRLLTLLGTRWYESFLWDPDQPWEAEERLTHAVASPENDAEAALALAGLYAQAYVQICSNDFTWLGVGYKQREERIAAWQQRFRERAAAHYERVLAAEPGCGAAASAVVVLHQEDWSQHQKSTDGRSDGRLLRRGDPVGARLLEELAAAAERALAINPDDAIATAGLAEAAWATWDDAAARRWYRRLFALAPGDDLAELRLTRLGEPLPEPAEPAGFGFLLFTIAAQADHHGGMLEESIVISDPVELHWAMAGMVNMHEDAPVEPPELCVYRGGRLVETRKLSAEQPVLDSSHKAVPAELPEPLLPWGHPVHIGSRTYQHGYNVSPPTL
jgi:hypothetical protein